MYYFLEKKSLVTATTTRRKQQQEMIRKALLAEEERKREGRENFPMTTVPVTSLAAYEPLLHHGESEHEEGETFCFDIIFLNIFFNIKAGVQGIYLQFYSCHSHAFAQISQRTGSTQSKGKI